MRVARHYRAGKGGHGQGKNRHGARGGDLVVAVPPGSTVEGLEGERWELLEPGQRALVAAGGPGGHGNKRFASSTQQAPRFAERGLPGASGWIELRLRLLADAGLVGMPNAGKSSLLARLTRADPKVADYPFTTVEPVLGAIDDGERQLILADIPGLIEGAAEGAGLGHEFLAHVERCRLLLHLVELGGLTDPERAHETVRGELAAHGAGLDRLPELIVLTKRDLLPAEEVEAQLVEWREAHPDAAAVHAISSATGAGLGELVGALFAHAADRDEQQREAAIDGAAAEEAVDAGFEAEHITYKPQGSEGFEVERVGEGRYAVDGRGVEMLVARHDPANPEALAYLERRLREIGVLRELERAGFEPGDEVLIGEHAFELDPGG